MDNLYDTEKALSNAITRHDKENDGGNSILVGWVVVAEWIDVDGDPNLTSYANTGMPFWRVDGLLSNGHEAMHYAVEDET
jgi:hypothetical protein